MSGERDPLTSLSIERAREIMKRFASARVLVVGDVMLDDYIWGSVDRISPEAPVPVVRVRGETFMLGGAANVANNVAALGGVPILAGVIGNDRAGEEILAKMEELGLPRGGLVVDELRPTTRKTRVLANKQQVVRFDREMCHDIDEAVAGKLLRIIEEEMPSIDALLFQDYNKGVLTPFVIRSAISLARSMDKIVAVDPKFHNFFEFRGATLFKPNMSELEYAFGSIPADSRSLEAMVRSLKERIDSRQVLLTCGEEGMLLLDGDGAFVRIPAVSREVYDVSGAGDTVISTITLALAAGGEPWESSVLSNYAASVEVQKRGVWTVRQEEILEAMERHGGERVPER